MPTEGSTVLHELIFPVYLANGDAALGKYGGGITGAAADEGLFIKDHAY